MDGVDGAANLLVHYHQFPNTIHVQYVKQTYTCIAPGHSIQHRAIANSPIAWGLNEQLDI